MAAGSEHVEAATQALAAVRELGSANGMSKADHLGVAQVEGLLAVAAAIDELRVAREMA